MGKFPHLWREHRCCEDEVQWRGPRRTDFGEEVSLMFARGKLGRVLGELLDVNCGCIEHGQAGLNSAAHLQGCSWRTREESRGEAAGLQRGTRVTHSCWWSISKERAVKTASYYKTLWVLTKLKVWVVDLPQVEALHVFKFVFPAMWISQVLAWGVVTMLDCDRVPYTHLCRKRPIMPSTLTTAMHIPMTKIKVLSSGSIWKQGLNSCCQESAGLLWLPLPPHNSPMNPHGGRSRGIWLPGVYQAEGLL